MNCGSSCGPASGSAISSSACPTGPKWRGSATSPRWRALRTVPAASLVFHASRNHFSNWCMARTEFQLASRMRPVRVSEFPDAEGCGPTFWKCFSSCGPTTRRGVVVDFSRADLEDLGGFARIGGGSMGARGAVSGSSTVSSRAGPRGPEGVRVFVPPAVVLGTEVFDRFLSENDLRAFALSDVSDGEVNAAFLRAQLPPTVVGDLAALADRIRYPLAVRSSSLLEDSQYQPFAGIYGTCMLPNGSDSAEGRLRDLGAAIKLVYASTFPAERQGVPPAHAISLGGREDGGGDSEAGGRTHGPHFYPDFAGVARSYNYYPVMDLKAEDGIAVVALGFGKTVVEGGRSVRFSPGAPEVLPQFGSTTEILRNAQVEFYASGLAPQSRVLSSGGGGHAGEARTGRGGGGWDPRGHRSHLVRGQRRRLRWNLPARHAPRHLRADAEAPHLPTPRDPSPAAPPWQ